jgi:hypothetical protein
VVHSFDLDNLSNCVPHPGRAYGKGDTLRVQVKTCLSCLPPALAGLIKLRSFTLFIK